MFNQPNYHQPKFVRETRLGLVVHGGISLAIYTYGVCQEFCYAVRGRGIYKLVKALTDSDLVIDAISGSSFCGINGILLAYTIANSSDRELVDFAKFARIWCNSGNLLKLLQKPHPSRSSVTELGLGDREFYGHELVTTLARGVDQKLSRSPSEWFSVSRELDLTIFGTDYLGRIDRQLDPTGVRLEAKNHHVLFHLKHRQGRKEPFNPHYLDLNLPRTATDTYQALAKLGQITAGIPVIAPLVTVDLFDRQNLVDRQLVLWGKLGQYHLPNLDPERQHKLYFLDGGLLDNAPFTCMMKATYYRLPERSSQRKLFYIDPSQQAIEALPPQGRKQSLSRQSFVFAALSVPIRQSITHDLQSIQEHNHKIDRYRTLLEIAESSVNSKNLLASADQTQSQIYLRGRLFDLRDRYLPMLLHSDLEVQNSSYSVVIDKIDRILDRQVTNSQDRKHQHKLLNRFEAQIVDLDVEYSLRRHFDLIDRIADLLDTNIDSISREQLQHLSVQLGCNIKLLEVIRAGIELLFSDRAICNYFHYLVNQESSDRRLQALIYELIFRLHRFLLDGTRFHTFIPNPESAPDLETIPVYFWLDLPELAAQNEGKRWLSQTRISSVFAQLKQRILDLHQNPDLHRLIWMDRQLEYDRNHNQSFPSILKQIDLVAAVSIEKSANQYTSQLLKQWNTFNCLDREVYPFAYLTNLNEKELIHPIGISPRNAQLGLSKGKKSQEKLAANNLYNIGGTFKKSWQANDLIWGRLDGLNRILEGMITPQSVTAFATLVERESASKGCSHTEYLDWLISESLPYLSGLERQTIYQHLERLAQPQLRIDRVELKQILADLVLAGHREILTTGASSIIEGTDEPSSWWRLPGQGQSAATSQTLAATDLSAPIPNPSTVGRIIRQSLKSLASQQRRFFQHQYRIDIDKLWENMPLVTLISWSTKIVLILRRVLLSVFGTSLPSQTMRHPLYHWLDGNLQSLYWWLQGGSIKLGAAHRRPRIILIQLVSAATVIGGVILAFLSSPFWLLVSLPGATICWFLQTMRLKRLNPVKTSRFLPQSRSRD